MFRFLATVSQTQFAPTSGATIALKMATIALKMRAERSTAFVHNIRSLSVRYHLKMLQVSALFRGHHQAIQIHS